VRREGKGRDGDTSDRFLLGLTPLLYVVVFSLFTGLLLVPYGLNYSVCIVLHIVSGSVMYYVSLYLYARN